MNTTDGISDAGSDALQRGACGRERGMSKLRVTPAAWTGMAQTDPRESRLNTSTALAVIIGGYLCFFAAGITNALYAVGTVLNPVDYSTPRQVGVLTLRVGEIAGALVLFFLVRQWLNIPASLAGTPRRRTSPLPSLFTVVMFGGGYLLAGLVLNALRASDANATGGGVVPNAMAWVGGPVTGINAGIVEEIIIVAIPVLLGRRAGWHPMAIVALSCFLRWPFHIYHDTWATIPWATLWGGANCLAYLYLRRLAPLVVLHATIDTSIDYGSAFGGGAAFIPVLGAALAFAVLLWRLLAARTRQLTLGIPTVRTDPAASRYLLRMNRRRYRRAGAGWVLFVAAFAAYSGLMYGWLSPPPSAVSSSPSPQWATPPSAPCSSTATSICTAMNTRTSSVRSLGTPPPPATATSTNKSARSTKQRPSAPSPKPKITL